MKECLDKQGMSFMTSALGTIKKEKKVTMLLP